MSLKTLFVSLAILGSASMASAFTCPARGTGNANSWNADRAMSPGSTWVLLGNYRSITFQDTAVFKIDYNGQNPDALRTIDVRGAMFNNGIFGGQLRVQLTGAPSPQNQAAIAGMTPAQQSVFELNQEAGYIGVDIEALYFDVVEYDGDTYCRMTVQMARQFYDNPNTSLFNNGNTNMYLGIAKFYQWSRKMN